MRIIVYSLLLFIWFAGINACTGIDSAREDRRVSDRPDRYGEDEDGEITEEITDDPKTLAGKLKKYISNIWSKLNQECDSSTKGIPRNDLDLGAGILGLGNKNVFTKFRDCMQANLEKASNHICDEQQKLYTIAEDYRGLDYRRDRIENHIEEVRIMEERYRVRLAQSANRIYTRAQSARNWVFEQELIAYADILREEAQISCRVLLDRTGRSRSRSSRY